MIGSYCLNDTKLTMHVWIIYEIREYHGSTMILLKLQSVAFLKIPVIYRDSIKLPAITYTYTHLYNLERKK